jgi:hypothetical protein
LCFPAGLSGGQRKLLLFELIRQRTQNQTDLLLVLDEPFAGVTDDFVPFIVQRLNEMRQNHNILLVTNDHVETLKKMSDNTITVSAIDRSTVQINGKAQVSREKMILALSVGEQYNYDATGWDDLSFFYTVEVAKNGSLMGVVAFTVFLFAFLLATFWDSASGSGALVIVAASMIAFFCLNPYLLSLVDWRNLVMEESEALLHSSKTTNKVLKTILTLILILAVSLVEWGVVNLVIDGFEDRKFWVMILMDSVSMTFPFLFFGLFTKFSHTAVEIYASLPFLFMIFLSGTFSPGAGVNVLKELRYLFSRYYFWCLIPDVKDLMENCPTDDLLVPYAVLSALIGLILFLFYQAILVAVKSLKTKKKSNKHNRLKDDEFVDLQIELYGEQVLQKDSLSGTSHSQRSREGQTTSSRPKILSAAPVSKEEALIDMCA